MVLDDSFKTNLMVTWLIETTFQSLIVLLTFFHILKYHITIIFINWVFLLLSLLSEERLAAIKSAFWTSNWCKSKAIQFVSSSCTSLLNTFTYLSKVELLISQHFYFIIWMLSLRVWWSGFKTIINHNWFFFQKLF